MKLFIQPRQTGKTTKLIKWMQEDVNRVLLVPNQMMVKQIEEQYSEFKGTKRILTLRDYLHIGHTMPRKTEVAVDELDLVLDSVARHRIKLSTLTNGE